MRLSSLPTCCQCHAAACAASSSASGSSSATGASASVHAALFALAPKKRSQLSGQEQAIVLTLSRQALHVGLELGFDFGDRLTRVLRGAKSQVELDELEPRITIEIRKLRERRLLGETRGDEASLDLVEL